MRLEVSVLALLAVAVAAACTAKAPEAKRSSSADGGLANGSFTADLNGFRIHYEVHGQGPVLMALTNSWGLSLEALRAMYRPLEEKLTLVYFDPRGMGGSGPVRDESDRGLAAVRADFQALRAHLKLEKVNAIGWSNGAINLVWLAHEHPETLSSAIFVHGMASLGPEDMKAMQAQHPELTKSYGALMAAVSKPGLSAAEQTALQRKMWLEDYFPTLCADPVKGRALVADVFDEAQLSWPHAAYTSKELPTFDTRGLLAAIPVRSLVIAGAHDMLPPERVKVLADGLPRAEFVVFEKSGHFSPVEEPEGFRAAVYAFLGVGDGEARRPLTEPRALWPGRARPPRSRRPGGIVSFRNPGRIDAPPRSPSRRPCRPGRRRRPALDRGRRRRRRFRSGALHQVRVPHPDARRGEAVHLRLRPEGRRWLQALPDPAEPDALQRRRPTGATPTPTAWAPRKRRRRRGSSSSTRTCGAVSCRRASSWTCGPSTPPRARRTWTSRATPGTRSSGS